jgi:hypothetical protein
MHQRQLTAARLRQIVNYCPETGAFTWLARADASPQWNGIYAGREAGHIKKQGGGYRAIGVEGKVYMAAQLAWLYVTGEWPVARIYYADGDNSNLAFSNLRQGDKAWANTAAPFSVQTLRNLLIFDQVSGEFTWNRRPRKGPTRVGALNSGHLRIMLFGKSYPAETLAWYYVTGQWPTVQIVHRNGDWLDNTFANLLGPEIPLTYDPTTGAFFRATMRVDQIISPTSVLVDDKEAARFAWYMQTGEWADEVHYRNGDPWDTSFANLSTIRPPPCPGRPGVEWKSKRHCWQARLVDRNGHAYTQLFANRFEAVEARERAERTLGRNPVEIEPVENEGKKPNARRPTIEARVIPSDTSSPCVGVHYDKTSRRWRAVITINGQPKAVGMFDDVVDAVKARKEAELLPGAFVQRADIVGKRPIPECLDSGCQGVRYIKPTRMWHASIGPTCLGSFEVLEDAIAARKAAELLPEHAPKKRGRPPKSKNIDSEAPVSIVEEDGASN